MLISQNGEKYVRPVIILAGGLIDEMIVHEVADSLWKNQSRDVPSKQGVVLQFGSRAVLLDRDFDRLGDMQTRLLQGPLYRSNPSLLLSGQGGICNLGEAFWLLDRVLDRNRLLKEDHDLRYSEPIIILCCQAEPTDDWQTPLARLKENPWFTCADRIACTNSVFGRIPALEALEAFVSNPACLLVDGYISLLERWPFHHRWLQICEEYPCEPVDGRGVIDWLTEKLDKRPTGALPGAA